MHRSETVAMVVARRSRLLVDCKALTSDGETVKQFRDLFSAGVSAGITAGGEFKVDLEKKMFIFDISCILGIRI